MAEKHNGQTGREAIVSPIWRPFFESSGVPAAVRDGDVVHVTGHTGEDDDQTFSSDPVHQIRRTFINLGSTLREAGTDWSEVVEVVSYHVGLRSQAEALQAVADEFLTRPFPAWTAVGVTELWDEGSIIEMSCTAVLGGPRRLLPSR
jgi:enamine deaminase RidA (YjgF/YER057c/UK114 family)